MNKLLRTLAAISAIGAINWGLIGFFNWNLVDAIFGGGAQEMTSTASRVVYAIVGLCGLGLAILLRRIADVRARAEDVSAGVPTERRRGVTREPPRPQA